MLKREDKFQVVAYVKPHRQKQEYRLYMLRSLRAHNDMARRAKKYELGTVPFSVASLRRVILQALGLPCRYCQVQIRSKSFGVDHAVPVSRGGKLALGNIHIVCQPCNRAKGDLTADEFSRLLVFLEHFQPAARRSVLSRLKLKPQWRG